MTHPLALVLSHVRAKARPGQYDAILLAEVDRLAAEVVRLRTIEHAARVQHEAYGAYPGLVEALGRSVVSPGTIATLTD